MTLFLFFSRDNPFVSGFYFNKLYVNLNYTGLRPDPATVPTNDTVDQEELGRVLTQLSSVNSNLEQKVSKLERRVDNGAEAAGDRSLTGGTNDIFTLDHVRKTNQAMNF